MRITTRGRYALRATLALAKLGKSDRPIPISTLSEDENISSIFLEQIFFKLRKAGIVRSVRGPGGGFCFDMKPEEITIKMILDAAGEELNVTECDKRAPCTRERETDCLAHSVWENLTALVNGYFSGITIASLIAKKEEILKRYEGAAAGKLLKDSNG